MLFVGNSLTYANDLPATVAAIAASAGDTVLVRSSVGPNLGLIDHLTGGSDAVRQIAKQPLGLRGPATGTHFRGGVCRDSMVLWTRMFDSLVKPTGGRTALFMTWPSQAQGDVWSEVRTSYQLAAQAVDGVFLPAGEAWHLALAAHPGLPLYGGDGFHPSAMGSFLAALEIYERLSGRDVRTLPAAAFSLGEPIAMSADTVRWLQQAAHAANAAWPAAARVTASPSAGSQRPPGPAGC